MRTNGRKRYTKSNQINANLQDRYQNNSRGQNPSGSNWNLPPHQSLLTRGQNQNTFGRNNSNIQYNSCGDRRGHNQGDAPVSLSHNDNHQKHMNVGRNLDYGESSGYRDQPSTSFSHSDFRWNHMNERKDLDYGQSNGCRSLDDPQRVHPENHKQYDSWSNSEPGWSYNSTMNAMNETVTKVNEDIIAKETGIYHSNGNVKTYERAQESLNSDLPAFFPISIHQNGQSTSTMSISTTFTTQSNQDARTRRSSWDEPLYPTSLEPCEKGSEQIEVISSMTFDSSQSRQDHTIISNINVEDHSGNVGTSTGNYSYLQQFPSKSPFSTNTPENSLDAYSSVYADEENTRRKRLRPNKKRSLVELNSFGSTSRNNPKEADNSSSVVSACAGKEMEGNPLLSILQNHGKEKLPDSNEGEMPLDHTEEHNTENAVSNTNIAERNDDSQCNVSLSSSSTSATCSQTMSTQVPGASEHSDETMAVNDEENECEEDSAKAKKKLCFSIVLTKKSQNLDSQDRQILIANNEIDDGGDGKVVFVENKKKSFEYRGKLYSRQTVCCSHHNIRWRNLSMCKICSTKSKESICLFKDFRAFPNISTDTSADDYVFVSSSEMEETPIVPSNKDLNRQMDLRSKVYTMFECAKALLPIMKEALKHAQEPSLLLRPREVEYRLSCDFCNTGLFSSSYCCRKCGQEFCLACRRSLVNEAMNDLSSELVLCTVETHDIQDLMPVSRFTVEELKEEVSAMESVIQSYQLFGFTSKNEMIQTNQQHDNENGCNRFRLSSPLSPSTSPSPSTSSVSSSLQSSSSSIEVEEIFGGEREEEESEEEEREEEEDEAQLPTHELIYFDQQTVKEIDFVVPWEEGIPVIIKGVKFKHDWSPSSLCKLYGKLKCTVVRCDGEYQEVDSDESSKGRKDEKEAEVTKFFSTFEKNWDDRHKFFGKGRWKLKDWPPADTMRESFPEIYKDFHNSIPLPDFTRRDGCKNLSSLFAKNANAPDLGPKMYNAWPGEHRKGGHGTTKLHMDIADAVNVLLYASSKKGIVDGEIPGAQWDIFRSEDSDAIREFMREHCNADQNEDPIHSQNFYLDDDLLLKLYREKGVHSWRIIQREGEAVFIPAGCAHQVCNLTDCIKIAVDFLSPQHIERCFTLTNEFRMIAGPHVRSWKEDVLQLQTQLWYAWCTCKQLDSIW